MAAFLEDEAPPEPQLIFMMKNNCFEHPSPFFDLQCIVYDESDGERKTVTFEHISCEDFHHPGIEVPDDGDFH